MKHRGAITIVSGNVGSGKTTFCNSMIEALKDAAQADWSVKGILSPAVFEGDTKIGIDALDLATGERRRLAQRRTDSAPGIKTKEWSLDRDTIEWCNKALHSALPCDLFVVDELGPLEFERDEGFYAAIEALDSGQYRAALVVVRTQLLHFAEAHWPHAQVFSIHDRNHALASAAQFASNIQQ